MRLTKIEKICLLFVILIGFPIIKYIIDIGNSIPVNIEPNTNNSNLSLIKIQIPDSITVDIPNNINFVER